MSFEHAPVTRGLMITTALSSLLIGLLDVKHYFHLQLVPHISVHHQYWRLLVHHLAFANSSDVFLAELLFFHIGIPVERQFGSWKFASFALIVTLLATVVEFLSLLIFHGIGFNYVPAGPLTLVYSILYQHARIIPAVYSWRLFGLKLSNDSFNQFLAVQLALSRLPGSLAPCIIGLICGQLYRSDLVTLKGYRISHGIMRVFHHLFRSLFGASRPPRRSNRALPDNPSMDSRSSGNDEVITTARNSNRPSSRTNSSTLRGRMEAVTRGAAQPSAMREWMHEITGLDRSNQGLPSGLRVPEESEITQVTSMFPELQREVIVAALQRSRTTQGAVETLLNSSPSSSAPA